MHATADVYLMPILYYMTKGPESAALLAKNANLTAYFQRHMERASVKSTVPPGRPGTAQAA
jgi:hypothetical protein